MGSRLGIGDSDTPKPMVRIGGMPMIWHIMKIYSQFGMNDFLILGGYKSAAIKTFFMNYAVQQTDIEVQLRTGEVTIHSKRDEDWNVRILDTGEYTMTGGRLLRAKHLLKDRFLLTYGDGVGNVNIKELIESHEESRSLVTLTAVNLPGRFGSLNLAENKVTSFVEKPRDRNSWVNGGFFVVEPQAIDYVTSDETVWERDPLENIARSGNLHAYKHFGFWKPMDTQRDVIELNELCRDGHAPWYL